VSMSSAKRLRQIRTRLGIGQRELERELGLPHSIICNIEAGRAYPWPRMRSQLAGYFARELGLDPDYVEAALFPWAAPREPVAA